MLLILTLCTLTLASSRTLREDFVEGILPAKRVNQTVPDYMDTVYRNIDDQFDFIFKEPNTDSPDENNEAKSLIGNFMQGMLLTSLSTTSCRQLKSILMSPRPYGPGLHEFTKSAIDQYIINES